MDKRCFTLTDWLRYLENRHAQEIQLDLLRIRHVAQRLNLLSLPGKVITIAGTNGKGSTVAALEAIYHAAGYRVASYTSPHLLKFNDRIRLNLKSIDDETLCNAFYTIEQGCGEAVLTYFEMITLAAFWYFSQFDLDIILLEVGLGGRLDATNIIDADLAVITTVDFDHQQYLGNTLEQIGREKAGIIRENRPCIYADYAPLKSVIDTAQAHSAPLYCLGEHYHYERVNGNLQVKIKSQADAITVSSPTLNHQAAAAAIMASYCLRDVLPVTTNAYQNAFSKVTLLGRQQLVALANVTLVLDVAHNVQAVSWLAKRVNEQFGQRRIHAVFSALMDKDIPGLINSIKRVIHTWYPAQLTGKRAAPLDYLLTALQEEKQSVVAGYANPGEAYQDALRQAKPGDVVLVFGSFLLVSAVMNLINENNTRYC